MVRSEDSPCCQKYGVPLYGASWVPEKLHYTKKPKEDDEEEEEAVVVEEVHQQEQKSDPTTQKKCTVVLCGGGGEGRSGIPNSLLLPQYDRSSNSLSPNPVTRIGTGDDVPYRMAIHPGGEGLICSFFTSCRWFEWVAPNTNNDLELIPSKRVLTQLEDAGLQLALTFNREGSLLAVGGEHGRLRVFKWPTMEVILDEAGAYKSVKDLDFSCDGKFLVSLGNGGPCRVWDVTTSTIVASLPKENDEVFSFSRFSQHSNNNQILYITAMRGNRGNILVWDTTSWRRVRSKHAVSHPITAFNVSADGKLLAIGTMEGDISIVNSANMVRLLEVKKAHLGLVTAFKFSEDSRYLLSASMDASARVTRIECKKKQNGLSIWVILLVILLAILVYLVTGEATSSCPLRSTFFSLMK